MRKPKRKPKTKAKAKAETKARETTKTTRRSAAKRRPDRNAPGDQPLSFGRPAKDEMTVQTAPAAPHPVHDSINLVLAECDKVAAALIELTRDEGMPPLATRQVETAGWAVVSADPQRPLTESEAQRIVAAMRQPGTPAPVRIAAE